MSKRLFTIIFACFFSIIFIKTSFGQAPAADSIPARPVITNTINNYYTVIGTQSRLYNGLDYGGYSNTIKGSAYFMDSLAFVNGVVDYDGIVYHRVPLLYDIHKDILVSLLNDHVLMYSLLTEMVKSFDVAGHHFVNIGGDTTNLKPGYYNEAYHGKLRVLVRREKSIQTSSNLQKIDSYFESSISYFLKKGNTYYKVSSEGAVLDVLKTRKKELKQYLKTNNIKFRKEPEKALVMLANYYDQLTD